MTCGLPPRCLTPRVAGSFARHARGRIARGSGIAVVFARISIFAKDVLRFVTWFILVVTHLTCRPGRPLAADMYSGIFIFVYQHSMPAGLAESSPVIIFELARLFRLPRARLIWIMIELRVTWLARSLLKGAAFDRAVVFSISSLPSTSTSY